MNTLNWKLNKLIIAGLLSVSSVLPASTICLQADDVVSVTEEGYSDGLPVMSETYMKDASGAPVSIGTETSLAASTASLKKDLKDPITENASKSVVFESAADARNGIAKVTLDAAGIASNDEAYDVVLVLDESGSMNMASSTNQNNISPDLNQDHYYCIPKDLFGNDSAIYFQLKEFNNTAAFQPWSANLDLWNLMVERFNLSGWWVTNAASQGAPAIMNKWQPWNNEYVKNPEGSVEPYTHITFDDLMTDGTKYCSPGIGNKYACYDRMIIEKAEASILSKQIENSGAEATISVVGFNSVATTRCQLQPTNTAAGIAAIDKALQNTDGGGGTSYYNALDQAASILNSRTGSSAGRKAYVIFITDGTPYDTVHSSFQDKADALKSIATVHATGIYSGAIASLRQVASSDETANDCMTTSDFDLVISNISKTITNSSVLTDTIGNNYSFYVDSTHPVTGFDGTAYTSIPSIPPDIKYNALDKTVTWTVAGSSLRNGERISFYEKLDDGLLSLSGNSGSYDTNEAAELVYHNVVSGIAQKDQTVSLKTYAVQHNTETLHASLSSNQMTENDPSLKGNELTDGDDIIYTITLTNPGTIDTLPLSVKDYIPANTSFTAIVSGDGCYSQTNDCIIWTIPVIKANTSVSVSFQVKVNSVSATENNETILNTFTWGWGTEDMYEAADPVCTGNTLINPTSAYTVPISNEEETADTSDHSGTLSAVVILSISLSLAGILLLNRRKYSC